MITWNRAKRGLVSLVPKSVEASPTRLTDGIAVVWTATRSNGVVIWLSTDVVVAESAVSIASWFGLW